MQFSGTITRMMPMQSGVSKAGKSWQKVDFVVEEAGNVQYPESVIITAFGDRVGDLTGYKEGDMVAVIFDAHARSYTGRDGVERWMQNNNLYKIAGAGAQQQPQQPVQQPQTQPQAQPQQQSFWNDPTQPQQAGDDLPF